MGKEFFIWVLRNYTNCGPEGLKHRYPKTTEEMNDCFTIDELLKVYNQKWWDNPPF